MSKAELKTKPTEATVARFIAGLPDERRREEARALDAIYRRVTGLAMESQDLYVVEDIQRQQAGGLRRRVATALVGLGIKVDQHAALRAARDAA